MKKKLGLYLPLTLAISFSSLVACNKRHENNLPIINQIETEQAHKMSGYWVEAEPKIDEQYPPEDYIYALKIDTDGQLSPVSLDPEDDRDYFKIAENGQINLSHKIKDEVKRWSDCGYASYQYTRNYLDIAKYGVGVATLESPNIMKIVSRNYIYEDKNVISKESDAGPTEITTVKKLNAEELQKAKSEMEQLKAKDDQLMAALSGKQWILDREEQTEVATGKIIYTTYGYNTAKSYKTPEICGSFPHVYHNLRTIEFLEDGRIDINNGDLVTTYKIRQGIIKLDNTSEQNLEYLTNLGKVIYEDSTLKFIRNNNSVTYKALPSGEKLKVETPQLITMYYKPKPELNLASELAGTKWTLLAQMEKNKQSGEINNYASKHITESFDFNSSNGKTVTYFTPKEINFISEFVLTLNDETFAAQYEIFNGHLIFDNSTRQNKHKFSQGVIELDGDNLKLVKTTPYFDSTTGKSYESERKFIYKKVK